MSKGVQNYINQVTEAMARHNEHRKTVKGRKFDTIAVHAFDGSPTDFYNWSQMGCYEKDICDPTPFQ